MSLITVNAEQQVVGDVDELGRRLRAVFIAMAAHPSTHAEAVAVYDKTMAEVWPAQNHMDEGSWSWWAKKICCDDAPYGESG